MDVLLIIDIQTASFTTKEIFDSKGLIQRINILAAKVRNNGGKVIFIQHDGNADEGLLPFSKGWALLPSLKMDHSDITIRKTICDSFYQTELKATLDRLKVERLLITGWATDFCVDTTIRASVSHGYSVIVPSNCHSVGDRPHLKAEQVIEHHNWVWDDLIVPAGKIQVLPMERLYI